MRSSMPLGTNHFPIARRLRRFVRDRRGVAAIEFAILAIPLFVVIMGGIEFGFMMFAKARLGGILERAARMATTGSEDTNGVDGTAIDAMVRRELALTRTAQVIIDKTYYDSFDQVRQPEEKNTAGTTAPYCWTDVNGNQKWDADPVRTGIGGANDIINYKVTLRYAALFPLVTKLVTKNAQIDLQAQATLQNEPFEGGKDETVKQCCMSAALGNPVTCTDT